MTNWLGVESAMDSQVPMLTHYCPVMESSLWYITCLAGLRPIHPCVQRRSFLQQPIQMPPHSRQSQIFKRAFAHLMMHDSFSVLFMLAVCGWGCRLDGESVCVFTGMDGDGAGLRAGEEWLCETATDRQMGVGGGGRGWGCKGPRLLKSGDADSYTEAVLAVSAS